MSSVVSTPRGLCSPNVVIIIEGFLVTPSSLPTLTAPALPLGATSAAPPPTAVTSATAPATVTQTGANDTAATESADDGAQGPVPAVRVPRSGLQSNSGGGGAWRCGAGVQALIALACYVMLA